MSLSLSFLGGVGTVTGSRILLQTPKGGVLIDCGLFQGLKELRLQNRAEFPVDPGSIHALLLTHAHLDHSGYIPALVRAGFRGKIYCTPPTRDLTAALLYDSAHIQEEDAAYANKKGYSKHKPALPLYTRKDVAHALERFVVIQADDWSTLMPGVKFRFSRSGHILGSAFVEVEAEGRLFVFSGDVGRENPLLLCPPARLKKADFLVVESTYGDRNHPHRPPSEDLARIVNETLARGGRLVIPSFAVGRAQELMHLLSKLIAVGTIPRVPVHLDSPLGETATRIFEKYPKWHRLSEREVEAMRSITSVVESQEDSQRLMRSSEPAIIIAGSGMAAGGRVLHHLGQCLPDERNTILLVGYQAAGTRGRLLLDGASEIKFHGQFVPVRARIESIASLSAHADQHELLAWLREFETVPRNVFIVHGELQASEALLVKIRDGFGWKCTVPRMRETVQLPD